jgi:hypothetical protein
MITPSNHKEVLKEDEEDLNKVTASYGQEQEEDSNKVTASYGSANEEELNKVTAPYGPEHEEDLLYTKSTIRESKIETLR